MKSLITLITALLEDSGSICSVDPTRDINRINSRVKHEGISFLTITLPEFASDFERALELGRVDSTLFVGWRRRGCLPAFMQGFTSLVFGPTGGLYENASIDAIFCVRQVCRTFKKLRIGCSSERLSESFRKFRATEAALLDTSDIPSDRLNHFGDVSSIIWSEVLGGDGFNPFDERPRHGPGATAEKLSGNAKYTQLVWTHRLEPMFPFTEYLFTSVSQIFDKKHGLDAVQLLSEDQELPVRVIAVPKTLKAPRIIAIEPVCMQYVQQAVARWIMMRIEKSVLTRDSVRFTDQTVNQKLALTSSSTGSNATIDLSDASDRVTLSAVQIMLRDLPYLLEAIKACRSTKAKLPDSGPLVHLKKFASMGSALCFPIESMYFFTILVHALLWKRGQTPCRQAIIKMAKRIHVYGDDLIVPVTETDTAFEALAIFGCKVNTTKSFWKGKFRESCGTDAYSGINVTPVYVREMCPSGRRSSPELLSWVSTSNQFHSIGMWKTAAFMKMKVERLLGELPVVADESPGLGWTSFCGVPSPRVFCVYTQKPVVSTYKVDTRQRSDPLSGYPALLKFFLNVGVSESQVPKSLTNKDHLKRSVRCGTVSRKRHWISSV